METSVAGRGVQAGGEEKSHFKHALRRLHVFAGHGAADGGFVDADDLGDLRHVHGLQMRDALFHELALAFHDFPRDVQDGLLALVEAFDEEFSGADFFANVILHLGGISALRHEVLVGVADAQVRNLLVVGRHHEIVAGLLHENLGQNILVGVRQERPARTRLQARDAGERGLDFLDGLAGAARDFRDAPLAQLVHEVADDAIFEGFLPAGAFQLEQQAFAQIARANAGRIECLDDFQDFGNFFSRAGRWRRKVPRWWS